MDALSKLKQRNRRHAQLTSGLAVAYHLPDIKLCIVEAEELGEEASQLRKAWFAQQGIVAHMLDAIEGEEVTERDDRWSIAAALDPGDRAELVKLGSPAPPEEIGETLEERAAANETEWLAAANGQAAQERERVLT